MKKDRDAAQAERFLATPEGQEWHDFVQTANKALEFDTEMVSVPAAFLRRVIADIAVDPLMFPAMAEAWERAKREGK